MNVGQIVKGVDDGQSYLNVTNSLSTVIDGIQFLAGIESCSTCSTAQLFHAWNLTHPS